MSTVGEPQPVGLFYSWWQGDPIPDLPHLPGLTVVQTEDHRLLDHLSGLGVAEIERRMQGGHVPYVAFLDGDAVAYGWSAWRQAGIGELGIEFDLPQRNRYLWDFVTLPEWRGRGIYSRLLLEILRTECHAAERFWIGHDMENIASGRGILTAGFSVVGEVWIVGGRTVFVSENGNERAARAADLLQIPLGTDA